MLIVLDGMEEEVPTDSTVLDLLSERGEPTTHVIVELNGSFVHPDNYRTTKLQSGDRLEVLYPAFGG